MAGKKQVAIPRPAAARVARLLRAMRGIRIAVAGDLMLDRYVWGSAQRLSPEAPVPVVDFASESECPGGAGNVAANLAALGARVATFGVTGDDAYGGALRRCLAALGLPAQGVLADPSRTTTVKTRIIARHQQVVRVDRESRAPLARDLEERLIRRIVAGLRSSQALVISDYDKGVITEELAGRILGAARRLGLPAFVKPKWSRLPTYQGATAIVCNRAEAGFLVTRALEDDESVAEAGRALLAHFGCSAVVITRGERGLTLVEHDDPRGMHIPATSRERSFGRLGEPDASRKSRGREVFDVTGAGDTVLATFSLEVAAGASFAEAAVAANAAAGVVVGKLGTAAITPAELGAALRELR